MAAAGYRTPKAPHVGRGIAISERPPAGGESHAAVTLNPDGSVVVHTSIFEPGTGTYTILRQIVAEELQLPLSCIEVQVWDTDGVPSTPASAAVGSHGWRVRQPTWPPMRRLDQFAGWPPICWIGPKNPLCSGTLWSSTKRLARATIGQRSYSAGDSLWWAEVRSTT